jgi:hypothetical protein
MSITNEDAQILRNAGFLELEIRQIAEAVDPAGNPQPRVNLNSPLWQRAILSRQEWLQNKIAAGWTEAEIRANLEEFYARGEKRDVWAWLKIEYRPPQKLDYRAAVRKREREKVKAVLADYPMSRERREK